MSSITWNTDVNAPCCPGEIVDDRDGQTILVQRDYDFPGVAGTFGWSIRNVQRCPACKSTDTSQDDDNVICDNCDCRCQTFEACDHDGTDGTVNCPECGVTAAEFISAAGAWLRDNDGATADDPGYF